MSGKIRSFQAAVKATREIGSPIIKKSSNKYGFSAISRTMYKYLLFIFLLSSSLVKGQLKGFNDEKHEILIKKAKGKIVIDGKLDEQDWQTAVPSTPFHQNFPFDTSLAQMQTVARVTFDDNFLYISGVCYQPKNYVVQGLRRDYGNGSTDIFFVCIDPFRDKLNGFYFAVNPYGVQKEALIANGDEMNIDWDNKWFAETTQYEDKYIVEMAIPFKTLRYKVTEGLNAWNINFARNNLYLNERSSWAPIGRNFRMIDVTFAGRMNWEQAPPQPGKNVSIIPYTTVNASEDKLRNIPLNSDVQAGFDAKLAVTPSLNLDITVNPDFAQAEVDRQITNLSRFELFFPERRQFFLENSDLFGAFGYDNINPFFSRRIGLGRNVNNGQNVRVPIVAGARLSGRLNKDWRVGLLNMQTAKSTEFGLPATNFSVAALQRRVGRRNNLGLIAVNKQEFDNKQSNTRFNRIIGMDYNMASADGKWGGQAFIHRTITPRDTSGQYAMAGFISYNTPTFSFDQSFENVGTNYKADVGFVPRNGYLRSEGNTALIFFPADKRLNKHINNWRISFDYDLVFGKNDSKVTDLDAGMFFRIGFQNSAELTGALLRMDYTYLFFPFDPTNTGGKEIEAGRSYTYLSQRWGFRSNARKRFFFNTNLRFGQYFNGKIFQSQNSFSYRIQPYGIFSVDVNYTGIRLPKPYNSANLWLIGPRAEISFNRSLFFNAFMQYNNQVNNVNLNLRLQYRFKPVSDFFLVYTDNYFATDEPGTMLGNHPARAFQSKNRALVAKLTYWFNL